MCLVDINLTVELFKGSNSNSNSPTWIYEPCGIIKTRTAKPKW
jgi:hypothetical protein